MTASRLSERQRRTLTRSNQQANSPARHDGNCSIRIIADGALIALATTAMSSSLSDAEKIEAARRITALWNATLGIRTEVLEEAARQTLSAKSEAQ